MKKFLAGSAIASIYTTNGDLIAISNTQINDTINLSVESQEVRSGYGNALDYIYYHTTRMEGQLEDAQFNLDYIKQNLGAKESKGTDLVTVYDSKEVEIPAAGGEVSFDADPLLVGADNQGKVWIYYKDKPYTYDATYSGDTGKITFTTSAADLKGNKVCVKYLTQKTGSNLRNLTISANFIPNVVSIVLEAQLFSSESGAADSSKIGTVTIRIPRAQLSGTQEISMSASGVASTPLSYLALKADDDNGNVCSSAGGVYGYITEKLDESVEHWYAGVEYLAIAAVDDVLTLAVNDYIDVYALGENETFIIRPRDRVTYGYTAGAATTPTWVTTDADNYLSLDGKVKALTHNDSALTKVFVKIADVSSINGDSAAVEAAE